MVKKLPEIVFLVQNITAISDLITKFFAPDDGYIDCFFHISSAAATIDWQLDAQTVRTIAVLASADVPYTFRIPVAKNITYRFLKASAGGVIDVGSAVYFRR